LIGTPDTRWNDSDLACLGNLTLSNFEPVNVSSIMLSASSGQTIVPDFTLAFGSSGTGTGTLSGTNCSTGTYTLGTVYNCTAVANPGSVFASWTDTCGGTIAGTNDSGMVNSACSVSANFIPTPPGSVWQGIALKGIKIR
jgi:hypothetical protein